MSVSLRSMEARDVPVVVSIIRAHDEFDAQCAERYFASYFADLARMKSDREQSFVAVEDETGAVVGICGFCPDKYDTPNVVWGSWFYVAQEHRGQGIGRMLLRHTLSAVQKLGVAKLYLDTSNEPKYARAVAMYERYGFKTEGVLVDYYGKGSHFVIMGRDMAGAETA